MTPMSIILIAVLAVAAGLLAGWLIAQRRKSSLGSDLQQAIAEQAVLKKQLEMVEVQKKAVEETLRQSREDADEALRQQKEEAQTVLTARLAEQKEEASQRQTEALDEARKHYEALSQEKEQRHAEQVSSLNKRIADAEAAHAKDTESQKQHYEARLAEQEPRHSEAARSLEERFGTAIKMLREQMENATGKMLKERQEEFATSSKTNLDSIVNPLKETIDKMKEEMAKNSTVQTAMSAEIRTNMEHMIRQSIEAQRSAEELTRAFKHESKTQGNWGEVVLSNLLTSQGFTEGQDFVTQKAMRDADGNPITNEEGGNLIPDVLLHLDGERDVIIDSKVSMTAYINYVNAEDEADRRQYLKEHVASIKKHVEELAAKDYTQYQTASHIDFVIMFVPQTQALMVATEKEPTLWQEAMQRHVFITDEPSLYAALRIIRITWTHIDQERSHKQLFELAQEMINRTGAFLKEYESVGRNLQQALSAFDNGKKKLLPGGHSIGTTARQILQLSGVENQRPGKGKRGQETIIPLEYIGEEETLLAEAATPAIAAAEETSSATENDLTSSTTNTQSNE